MAEGIMLTLQEVSELEGKSWASIRMAVKRGKLQAKKVEVDGKCGFEYRVPVSELSESAKVKYYATKSVEKPLEPWNEGKEGGKQRLSLEEMTKKQRETAYLWEECIKCWRSYVHGYEGLDREATKAFIAEYKTTLSLSPRTLYRKWQEYRQVGLVGLADERGKARKGRRSVDERLQVIFEDWYLDENEPSVRYCYDALKKFAQLEYPQLKVPSESTFRRMAEDIPLLVRKYFREGERVFDNEVAPYVKRRYDFLSNEYWSADYHTLDLMVRDDLTGRIFRPHVVTWIDVRSRKILALRLAESSNSDNVILAFKDALLRFGIPASVYLDNGREFLVHDFGGRGTRKTDSSVDRGTNILDRFGIRMVNAKVRNSKAKVIERSYRVVSEQFAKLYLTFCGNNPVNRPERHAKVLKKEENIPLLSEVTKQLRAYIEGFYNENVSEAEGLNRKSPNFCYGANLVSQKTAPVELVNIHLLRSSNLQTFQRNGVTLTFGDTKLQFYNEELVERLFKRKVYVHYDTEDLSKVRIYDEQEVFVGEATQKLEGGYQAAEDLEAIKKNNSAVKALRKRAKHYKSDMVDNPRLLDAVMRISEDKIRELEDYKVNVLEMIHLPYERERKVSGDATLVSFDRMIENAKKGKGVK